MPNENTEIILPSRARRSVSIKGLMPSLPERGKIKIGMKGSTIKSSRGNEFQPPQKLDHFRVTTLQRGNDGNFLIDEAFHERHGERPTEIPIRLLYDDPAVNFPTRYACFLGRTLWCSGDGEVAIRLSDSPPRNRAELDQLRPEPREVKCPCIRQEPSYQERDKCKMNGSLSVIIDGAGGVGGVWKFRTTSYNSIVGIMSSMAFIRSITGGPLANIPLKLKITAKQATAPTDGSAVLIYVVGLEFEGDISDLQDIGHRIALDRAKTHVSIQHIEDEARRLLAAPRNAPLPGDNADDIVEEFYPEQVATPPRPDPEQYKEPPAIETQRGETQAAEASPEFVVVSTDADGEFREIVFHDPAGAAVAMDSEMRVRANQRGYDGLEAAWEDNGRLINDLRQARRNDLADHLHKVRSDLAVEYNSYSGQPRPSSSADPGHSDHPGDSTTPTERMVERSDGVPDHPSQAGSPHFPSQHGDDGRQGVLSQSLAVPLRKAVGHKADYRGTAEDMIKVIDGLTDPDDAAARGRFKQDNRQILDLMRTAGEKDEGVRDAWRSVEYRLGNRERELRGARPQ